jgi:hypothetical protein
MLYAASYLYGFNIGSKEILYPSGFGYADISSDLTDGSLVQTYSSETTWGMIVILYS